MARLTLAPTVAFLTAMALASSAIPGCDKKDATKTTGPGSPPATATEQGGPPGAAAGGMGMRQDLSSPQATLQTLARAMELGDVAVAKEACTPESQPVAEVVVGYVTALKKLDQAGVVKFGPEGRIAGPELAMGDRIEALRNATVTLSGDTAVAHPKQDDVKPIPLRKVNGQWQADATALPDVRPGQSLDQVLSMTRQLATAAEQTARDIAAGKYASAQDAKEAFGRQSMAAALPAVMSNAGGGSGAAAPPATQAGASSTTQPARPPAGGQ
jgi:hypothetical protein